MGGGGGVGGLEPQTDEDIAKKSTRPKRFAQHVTSLHGIFLITTISSECCPFTYLTVTF